MVFMNAKAFLDKKEAKNQDCQVISVKLRSYFLPEKKLTVYFEK